MTSQISAYLPDLSNIRNMDARSASTAAAATVGTFAALSAAWVVRDYNQWVSFGSGGTPPTPSGYWRMTKLRWRAYWSGDDMRNTSSLATADGPKNLTRSLPQKQGQRPKILARTMPQRQQPEPLDPKIRERLHGIPAKFCKDHPD